MKKVYYAEGVAQQSPGRPALGMKRNEFIETPTGFHDARHPYSKWRVYRFRNHAFTDCDMVAPILVEPHSGFSIVIISDRGGRDALPSALMFDAFGVGS